MKRWFFFIQFLLARSWPKSKQTQSSCVSISFDLLPFEFSCLTHGLYLLLFKFVCCIFFHLILVLLFFSLASWEISSFSQCIFSLHKILNNHRIYYTFFFLRSTNDSIEYRKKRRLDFFFRVDGVSNSILWCAMCIVLAALLHSHTHAERINSICQFPLSFFLKKFFFVYVQSTDLAMENEQLNHNYTSQLFNSTEATNEKRRKKKTSR